MRRLIPFPCGAEWLLGTLDDAGAPAGLLIVSGGAEVRSGAHRGMGMLAARVAAAGHPVFRYDRRGTGDSTGGDRGWAGGADDLRAALAAFRAACPGMERVAALGNCDAAALLVTAPAGLDRLILTNPWLDADTSDGLPPAAAIRAHYAARLRDPREWRRLLTGRIGISGILRGLQKAAKRQPQPSLASAYAAAPPGTLVLLAEGDATARIYAATVRGTFANIRTASHSFAGAEGPLADAVLAALATT